jgi:hypothetical protein
VVWGLGSSAGVRADWLKGVGLHGLELVWRVTARSTVLFDVAQGGMVAQTHPLPLPVEPNLAEQPIQKGAWAEERVTPPVEDSVDRKHLFIPIRRRNLPPVVRQPHEAHASFGSVTACVGFLAQTEEDVGIGRGDARDPARLQDAPALEHIKLTARHREQPPSRRRGRIIIVHGHKCDLFQPTTHSHEPSSYHRLQTHPDRPAS